MTRETTSGPVLVTGARGYIGRHVVDALENAGQRVRVIVRPGAAHVEGFENVEADVLRDPEALEEELAQAGALVHLAWEGGFALNGRHHVEAVSGHYRFIELARRLEVPRIAVAGTMHEVGNWEGAVTSDTPTNPQNLYGIAKDALRRAILVPPTTSPSEVVWFRMYYVYGDDRRSSSVFSKVLEAADRGDATFPFTSGKNRYDFVHVDRLAEQVAQLVLHPGLTGVVNCGSGEAVPLGQQVEGFIREHGLSIRLAYGAFPDRPGDSPAIWGERPPFVANS